MYDHSLLTNREPAFSAGSLSFILLVLYRLFLAEVLGVAPAAVADDNLLADKVVPQGTERKHTVGADMSISLLRFDG